MRFLVFVGFFLLVNLVFSHDDDCNANWETLSPCTMMNGTCAQPARKVCWHNGEKSTITSNLDCPLPSDCGGNMEKKEDSTDEEQEEDSTEESTEDSSEEMPALIPNSDPDDVGADLKTGEKFCVSNCADEYGFLATYETGLALNQQELCENNLTMSIGGRGGPGCRTDDWFIVEECNDACYEFGWRASYPTYCDVEDQWLWCCQPKVETRGGTVCGQHDRRELPCVVSAYRNIIDSLTVMWFDAAGNDLSDMEGFEVSRTYKIQDDKLLSVLTVDSWAIQGRSAAVTCRVKIEGDDEGETSEDSSVVNKFDVEVTSEYQRVGSDASLVCTGVGAYEADAGYSFSWFYFDEGGLKHSIDEEELFSADQMVKDGQWVSVLSIPKEVQRIGSQKFQCVLKHTSIQAGGCHIEKSTEGDAPGWLTIWDVTKDTYCAHPGDEAELSFTVLGTHEGSTVDDGIIESLTKGTMITEETTFKDGFLMTITRNEKDEIVVILTISPNMTEDVGSEFFITYLKADGKEGVEPNLELNVMELQGAKDEEKGFGEEEDDDIVVVGYVEGGKLDMPVWLDDEGRVYRLGTNEDGVEVTLSEDKTESRIRIPKDVLEREPSIQEVRLIAKLYSETGTYCSRRQVKVLLQGDEPHCLPKWDSAVCDERDSCSDYTQDRSWSCYCDGEKTDQSECEAPDEMLTFTCPATQAYVLGPWEDKVCEREECYPYPVKLERPCYCFDATGTHSDTTGKMCGGQSLEMTEYCDATKPWSPGEWLEGECPSESCFDSETVDIRGCYCDGLNDRSKCDDDLVRSRDCPANRFFEWGDWGPEICDLGERCYPEEMSKTRSCTCTYYGQIVVDEGECDGPVEEVYSCDANLEWYPEPKGGDPCDEADNESCAPFTAFQDYRCVCEHGDILEVADDGSGLCQNAPRPVMCPANKAFEWSEWSAVTECSVCYPELEKGMSRSCTCGEEEDNTRCPGSAEKAEECPAPRNRVWIPTEWNDIPCGDLFCTRETFTTRTRTCECEGNKDDSRCEEDLTGVLSCGFAPYELSEWTNDQCDQDLCHPYSKNKTRSCVCEDSEGETVDGEQCDVGQEGFSQEFQCEGDSYEWGEWQSRGCPESCLTTKTKRYRICSCHGDVDFNSCAEGNAIEFYDCPPTKEC